MQSNRLLSLAIGILILPAMILGCGNAEEPEVLKREGEPDYVRADGKDERLNQAIAKARETYRELVDALAESNPDHVGYAVKKPFNAPEGLTEHIWINDLSWDGRVFKGVINNEPVDTDEVSLGDRVDVLPDELSDWMYVDGNTIVGGYTVRVLHYQQSEVDQKTFTEQTGLVVPPIDF